MRNKAKLNYRHGGPTEDSEGGAQDDSTSSSDSTSSGDASSAEPDLATARETEDAEDQYFYEKGRLDQEAALGEKRCQVPFIDLPGLDSVGLWLSGEEIHGQTEAI